MRQFLDDNFLLANDTAIELYHDWAAAMPIYDYHCHLPPIQVAENHKFTSITDVWLGGDHYKWRALRANGVDEELITGSAGDWEKFQAWAETMPYTIGNPLYQWTHLELRRYFGIDELLGPDTAEVIFARCNEQILSDSFRARELMRMMKVKTVCTTDDPVDDLRHHKSITDDGFEIKVYPAFRPDKAFKVDDTDTFIPWLRSLSETSGLEITTSAGLLEALENRIDYFHSQGCRLSDHGINAPFAADCTAAEADEILSSVLAGNSVNPIQTKKFAGTVLLELGRMYAAKGWTMQLHLGALRSNNTRMLKKLGPDTGYDSMGDWPIAEPLVRFLDSLDIDGRLPKTIIYCLNPGDNELIAAAIGSFQDGKIAGKMQFGSGWWHNDQRDGMERQMTALANLGLLSRFVGMVTDSRSFLSYPRHEYFRRVLCNLLGIQVENGEIPRDIDLIGTMVQDICYNNAKAYFGLGE
ncbi:MAG: glucuronate isomerase [Spirochaetales bacterium]|jgi:glucuronate isomerase|nr:glucuronate isomerase [Spirochaetales bacterium]